MKRLAILSTLFVICSLSVFSQSYSTLWKEAQKAQRNDLPRSALEIVARIQQKAEREGNTSQLIRALCSRLALNSDISNDSTALELSRIRAYRNAETRPVERALWNMALAKSLDRYSWRDTIRSHEADFCYEEMLTNIEALGKARAKSYLPLFVQGKQSAYFKHDLLHVLARIYLINRRSSYKSEPKNLALISRLISYYRAQGNQEATLLQTLDSLERTSSKTYNLTKSKDFERLQQVAKQYANLKLNVLTYIKMTTLGYRNERNDSILTLVAQEGLKRYGSTPQANHLRNFLLSINQPALSIGSIPQVVYPNESYSTRLSFKALSTCQLRIYQLTGITAYDWEHSDKQWSKVDRTLVSSYPFQVNERPPYVTQDTTINFIAPKEPGIYVLRLYDGKQEHDGSVFFCTRLKPMMLKLDDGMSRVSVVDAITGSPIKGTAMTLEYRKDIITHQPDAQGNYYIDQREQSSYTAFITLPGDQALPAFSLTNYKASNERAYHRTQTRLFTDRGIYRPGQKVIVGGFVFTQHDDSLHIEAHHPVSVTLYDSNHKEVASLETQTDELGNFSLTFQLPQTLLPGTFTLLSKGHSEQTATTIEVQEYKRPTFTIEIDPITQAYQPGDTLMLTGIAQTYSGLPVEGAHVSYETKRYEYFYWYRRGNEEANLLQHGDTITDANGHFSLPIVLTTASNQDCRTAFQTKINITAQQGETQSASQTTYVAHRKAYLIADWPETICFEHTPTITPRLINAQGNDIQAKGIILITLGNNQILRDSILTNKPYTITRSQLPAPGKYKVETIIEYQGEEYKSSSTVRFFSENDTRPIAGDDFWYNIRESEQGDTAHVIIGSALKDVTMYYDVYIRKEIVESKLINFSDSLLHYTLAWKPSYGDAASITFAFVKNNTLHSKTINIVKPKPNKQLNITWETFRSKLTPGQQEEWRMRVTLPDGTPAQAAVMARLYDASLDALKPYDWHYSQTFPRTIPRSNWDIPSSSWFSVRGNFPYKAHKMPTFSFTSLTPELFMDAPLRVGYGAMRLRGTSARSGEAIMAAPMYARATAINEMIEDGIVAEEYSDLETTKAADGGSAEETATVVPRTNFSETAFYYPTLRTDSAGTVTIAFTLPESLTKWNFRALAHTADMHYALADTSCIARKEFMVEPAMPRFLRQGDKAQIPVTIRNLTDKNLAGTLLLQLLDPATEKVILKQTLSFNTTANSNEVQTFSIDAAKLGETSLLTVRITGKSGAFSDGEEHYLPILSSREQVISTLPFTLTNHQAQTLRIDTLWSSSKQIANQQLTIEATSNPAWYAVTALPVLADRTCYSSTDWAERLYAIILARHIAQNNPAIQKAYSDTTITAWANILSRNEELKNTIIEETPWLAESEDEATRTAALASLFDESQNALREHTALNQLSKLQNSDGSWSWCPGMQGSLYMTTRIAVILSRLQYLSGYKTDMLPRAYSYIESNLTEYVEQAKKKKYKGCPYEYLRYLYAASLTNHTASSSSVRKAVKYLIEQIEDQAATEDMHTKSLMAVVLARYGKTEATKTALQSLIEHTTMADPQRGRFFDTHRAPMTWSSYRIPTQTSTIEALTLTAPDVMWSANGSLVGVRDNLLAEMRLWLLQAKRTQIWETSSASIDAIYALLLQDADTPSSELAKSTTPMRYTLQDHRNRILAVNQRENIMGAETAGYICDHYHGNPQISASSVTLRGYDNTVSWGSIYARYTLPMQDIVSNGKGLSITRRLEVRREGQWEKLDEAHPILHIGDRIRVVFTISADRDYDYVSLRTGRPACSEPADKLSGYRWTEAGGCYRVVRDADLVYFIEKLAKGTYTFTDELLIDRAGTYTFAPSRIQSLYSPEFQGISQATTIEAIK